jgi:hypothetical protein
MVITACSKFFAKFAKFAKFGYLVKLLATTTRKVDPGVQLRHANEALCAVIQSG